MTNVVPPASTNSAPRGEALRFARPSLGEYADTILRQAGIPSAEMRNIIFQQDRGLPVPVALRESGGGYDFEESDRAKRSHYAAGWLVFEKLPGDGTDYLRARLFDTFAGASAEFATRLTLQQAGNVTIRELERVGDAPHRGRNTYIAFEGIGHNGMCAMVMAPASTALDVATRLLYR